MNPSKRLPNRIGRRAIGLCGLLFVALASQGCQIFQNEFWVY